MTSEGVLRELLWLLEERSVCTVGWEQVRHWPESSTVIFENAGWIKPSGHALMVECCGCEESCLMRAHIIGPRAEMPAWAYVACDRHDEMGRVPIPLIRLQQWHLSRVQVAGWLNRALGLNGEPMKPSADSNACQLGHFAYSGKTWPVEMEISAPLCLKIVGRSIPLADVISVDQEKLVLDRTTVLAFVGAPARPETPVGENITEREGGGGPAAGSHPLEAFRSMEALKFKEIHIRIDPERLALRISARGTDATAPLSALGLTNKNAVTLNRQGELFMALANGTFSPEESGAERAISRLSASLREAFDTPDPPFSASKPWFRVTIPKDKEARRRALKRTVGFDDTRPVDAEVDADAFLRSYDPNFDPDNPLYSDDPDLGAGD